MSRPGLDTNPLELTPDWFNQLFEDFDLDFTQAPRFLDADTHFFGYLLSGFEVI